jgi:hypothetical protein
MDRDPTATYDQPLEIDTFDGEVVIFGPGAAGIALTASAAAQTAARLAEAAERAFDPGLLPG